MEVCEKAVRAGGAVLVEKIGRVEVREKGRSDLVTEADLASEDVVRRTILETFPEHLVVGEEGATGGGPGGGAGRGAAEYRWFVDPLDGTTNYVHQVPHFCVSLALEQSGHLLVGAVYNPVADEYYAAVAGKGAWLNGQPIRTSGVCRLAQALAAVGFPPGVTEDSADLRLFLNALGKCQAIRRTGSMALNLCYLAAGRFDVGWSFSTNAWDVAAGILLIREAGGVVTAPDGGPFVVDSGQYLAAANGPLLAELQPLVAESGLP
jgi:myo-inositol-1(or 4)-monophosphatase